MNCEEFNCIEVPVPDRKDEVHLEHCIKKFLSKEEVQYWEAQAAVNVEVMWKNGIKSCSMGTDYPMKKIEKIGKLR